MSKHRIVSVKTDSPKGNLFICLPCQTMKHIPDPPSDPPPIAIAAAFALDHEDCDKTPPDDRTFGTARRLATWANHWEEFTDGEDDHVAVPVQTLLRCADLMRKAAVELRGDQ